VDAQVEPLVAAADQRQHARSRALDQAGSGGEAQVRGRAREGEHQLVRRGEVERATVAVGERRRHQGDPVSGLAREGAAQLEPAVTGGVVRTRFLASTMPSSRGSEENSTTSAGSSASQASAWSEA